MKGRIKPGSGIMVDFQFGKWPFVPQGQDLPKKVDPDMIFDCTCKGDVWECRGPGFGLKGDYGNGSILLRSEVVPLIIR